MASSTSLSKDLRRMLAFGSGVGIEIGPKDLEVVVARVRPSGIAVLGRCTIENFATRPAAEWGADYARFLKSVGLAHLSATVLLPRRELIARNVSLTGVASKDVESAIRFQLDALHPYGEEDVCWGWSPLERGTALVGIARRETVDRYVRLFAEAGIAVSSFTCSAAAVHAAIRLNGHGDNAGFVALTQGATGSVEVYGESESRPVFSAEFEMAPQRAAALALSELRLPPETVPVALEAMLPKPMANPVENDLARNPMPYVTALAGACPRMAPSANILPKELRRLSSHMVFVPTIVLASIAVLLATAIWVYSAYADKHYLARLNTLIGGVSPRASRAGQLDREYDNAEERIRLLDRYREQTRSDLDALNELTRLIPPPAWTSVVELNHDQVRIFGEAQQAAPLPLIINSSPMFQGAALDTANPIANGAGEQFQIHAARRKQ
jgi:hypothetical protein